MTGKELKRLSRSDLLEMLLEQSKENDKLREENRSLRERLNDRELAIDNCGSLAEAALRLNGVFEAAQAACDQYAQNIRCRSEHMQEYCQQMERETREQCDSLTVEAKAQYDTLVAQAQIRCREMLDKAQKQAQAMLEEAQRIRDEQDSSYGWLKELMESGEAE
ncbi:MAG: hypothetical protein IJ001_11125 [Oscillospiraceae bacterium]|nr:hypothetical protein [Oscillospiraceae bacterium]